MKENENENNEKPRKPCCLRFHEWWDTTFLVMDLKTRVRLILASLRKLGSLGHITSAIRHFAKSEAFCQVTLSPSSEWPFCCSDGFAE